MDALLLLASATCAANPAPVVIGNWEWTHDCDSDCGPDCGAVVLVGDSCRVDDHVCMLASSTINGDKLADCPGDDQSFDIGFGTCETYVAGGINADYCGIDGACDACPCSCDCPAPDCPGDDLSWDRGYGECGTYRTGQINEGRCQLDGACDACGCSCEDDCANPSKLF